MFFFLNVISAFEGTLTDIFSICSIKGLALGSKDYTKELKTVECTRFLGKTS